MAAKKTTRRSNSKAKPAAKQRSRWPALLGLLALFLLGPPMGRAIIGWGFYEDSLPNHGSPIVVGDGLAVNVREQGQGVPIVLVHGLPSNATDWARTPELLAARGFRAIAYDRIGYGYSSRPALTDGNYTLRSNADDLLDLLNARGIQKAVLVGWSYGGGVVQLLASEHPERVSHVVLIGSVGPALRLSDDPLYGFNHSALAGPVMSWIGAVPPISRALVWDQLLDAFGSEASIPDGWLSYTQAMLALPGTIDTFLAEYRRFDVSGVRPEGLKTPSLVLQGSLDRAVPLEVAEDLDRRLTNSKFVVVEGGGHMLPVSRPERVADEIALFVHGKLN